MWLALYRHRTTLFWNVTPTGRGVSVEEKQKAAWAGVEANIRKMLRYSRSPVSVLQDLPRHVVSPKLRCPQVFPLPLDSRWGRGEVLQNPL